MPPKKKLVKKKKAKEPAMPVIIDGKNVADMSKEELENNVRQIRGELDREREERNYFQLERDKVNTFWEVTKRQLEERRADLRNKDREMEEMEERHQVEIKVYKQKVKHLLFEHQNGVTGLKRDATEALKAEQEEEREKEMGLRRELRALKLQLKETELAHEQLFQSLKLNHQRELTENRKEFERRINEVQLKYEDRLQTVREELTLRRKNEVFSIEEQKNSQISTLMSEHERAFAEMKAYYNDVTVSNLALIQSLKERLEDMKKREEEREKTLHEISAENKRLSGPLSEAQREMEQLRSQLGSYAKDKTSLNTHKARVKQLESEIESLVWEREVLSQRFQRTEEERNELYSQFVRAIHQVKQKTGLKNLILEKRLSTLKESLEKKEAQLNEVLSSCNLDPSALSAVTHKLDALLGAKNTLIRDLEYDLARVTKGYRELVSATEARLSDAGVSLAEHGLRTSDTSATMTSQHTSGPAASVVFPPLHTTHTTTTTAVSAQLGRAPSGLLTTAPHSSAQQ